MRIKCVFSYTIGHDRYSGVFFYTTARIQETLGKSRWRDNTSATPAHPQRTITTFWSPITRTNATSQSRGTQMGSRPGHNKGVTIDRAIAICDHASRPRPMNHDLTTLVIDGWWRPLSPAVVVASLALEISAFRIDLCYRSFEEKSYKIYLNLENVTCVENQIL